MKFKKKAPKLNVVKGGSSGFMISLAVHIAAFSVAGIFVVFTVVEKEEQKFVPPKPVDRPVMKLKKPRVKVKKTSQPKRTTRIVTKVNRASMPDIQLPELSGVGDGLEGNIGGFEIIPDVETITLFGGGQTIGNDFVGTFYDLKRDRSGRPMAMEPGEFVSELTKFVARGWKPSSLAKYYRSPKKLYATTFMVPPVRSSVAPTAFGESDTGGWCWAAHYKGTLTHHEDIRFRFWGHGDDVLVVRVGGELVLNACWPEGEFGSINIGGNWQSTAKNNFRFYLGNNLSRVGDWIELKAGEQKEMEILLGETPGGGFCAMLAVEVDGVEYPRNRQGGPILPMFKTEEPSLDLQDAIYRTLVPGEASVTGGPVFRDYASDTAAPALAEVVEQIEPPIAADETICRVWSTTSGKQIEGEYVALIGDRLSIRTPRGKQVRIPVGELSEGDIEFIELANPPEFNITFVKSATPRFIETTPHLEEEAPRVNDWMFGAKIRQTGARPYNHELTVEYYAIGKELIGDKYNLIERRSQTFIPSQENNRSLNFSGDEIELMEYVFDGQRRGIQYTDNLITITDKRGQVIQHSASSPWLWEYVENLKKIPTGRFMDKTATRRHPTSPKPARY